MPVCILNRFSHVWLFKTSWTVAYPAPLSMGFSRQEYWSGLPCPASGDLPDPGIEPSSLTSPALEGRFFTTSSSWVDCYTPTAVSMSPYTHTHVLLLFLLGRTLSDIVRHWVPVRLHEIRFIQGKPHAWLYKSPTKWEKGTNDSSRLHVLPPVSSRSPEPLAADTVLPRAAVPYTDCKRMRARVQNEGGWPTATLSTASWEQRQPCQSPGLRCPRRYLQLRGPVSSFGN